MLEKIRKSNNRRNKLKGKKEKKIKKSYNFPSMEFIVWISILVSLIITLFQVISHFI